MALILTRKASHVVRRTVGATAKRFGGVHVKTIDRWLKDGVRAGDERVEFPKPDLIVNSIRFWKDEQLDEFEREVEAAVQRQRARLKAETPSLANAGGRRFHVHHHGAGRGGRREGAGPNPLSRLLEGSNPFGSANVTDGQAST